MYYQNFKMNYPKASPELMLLQGKHTGYSKAYLKNKEQ